MSEKEPRDYWSDCGQIFFHHEKGYGLTDSLRTVALFPYFLNNAKDYSYLKRGGFSNSRRAFLSATSQINPCR